MSTKARGGGAASNRASPSANIKTPSQIKRDSSFAQPENPKLSSSTSSVTSPSSPSRLSRLREKEDLQNLNDRLAIYIDTVRRLESENKHLTTLVASYNETSVRDVSEIKTLYERELEESKRLIDELAKEKARLEIDVSRYKTDFDDTLNKLNKSDRELKNLSARVKGLELENQEYKAKLDAANNENTRRGDELVNLKGHASELDKQLQRVKKTLEEETLARVDLENKNQTLKEELQFKSQLYEKETEQLRSSKRYEIEQVDTRLRDEYDSRLINELQRIREVTDSKIAEMKDDVERRYQSKLADIESTSKRNSTYNTTMREEINGYKQRISDLTTDLANAQTKVTSLETRSKDAEDKYKRLQGRYDDDLTAKDAEISELRKEIHDLLAEYQELYDIKIALDLEIGAYRKLLESEEARLNISQLGSGPTAATSLMGSFLADDGLLRSNKKRRIGQVEEEVITSSHVQQATYTQSEQTTCGINILEHDFEGKCIKIVNTTDKDISLNGWQLRRLADGQEVEFKFNKSANIKSGQTIAVWSANANIEHEPPSDLVMAGQSKWFVGDKMITVLMNKEGEEQARRESAKNSVVDRKVKTTKTTTSGGASASSSEVQITSNADATSSSGLSKIFGMWKS